MCLRLTRPYIEGGGLFLSFRAGLLTSPHSEAPSHPSMGNGSCFVAIRGLTAAGQSEILTLVPN